MKLKFINLLLASGLLVGAAQVFTSCKDNESDLYADLKAEDLSLWQRLNQNIDDLKTLDGLLQTEINERKADSALIWDAIDDCVDKKELETLENTVESIYETLYGVDEDGNPVSSGSLIDRVKETESELVNVKANIATLRDSVKTVYAFYQTWNSILPTVQQNAATALAQSNSNKELIDSLFKLNDSVNQRIDSIIGTYVTREELIDSVNNINARAQQLYTDACAYTDTVFERASYRIDTLSASVAAFKTEVNTQLKAMGDTIDALSAKVSKLDSDVAALNTVVNKLTGRVEEVAERINGITINQVYNPILGSLNLPLGINSTVLFAFAGQVQQQSMFPLISSSKGSVFDNYEGLTAAEEALVGPIATIIMPGVGESTMIVDAEGNGYIGDVYMTINPAQKDWSNGYEYSLVNSRNVATPVKLAVSPSDKELTFGYSRSVDNGFYAATASINPDDANAIRFSINDDLKSEISSILSNPSASANVSTVASLGKALYNQFDGILPALAVKTSWTESTGTTLQVTSDYQIAATVVNPLSFNTLKDKSFRQIPSIPDLDQIADRFNVWFDNLTGDIHLTLYDKDNPFKLTFDKDDYTMTIDITDLENIDPEVYVTVTGTVYDEDGKEIGTSTGKGHASLSDLKNALIAAFQDANEDINKYPDSLDKIVSELNTEINDMLTSMQTNIDETIDTVLSNIQSNISGKIESITSKISKFTDRIQTVINRLNNVLADPNHYLQPALLYKAGSSFGKLSTAAAVPTQFKLNSGNAVTLVPTTLTAEVIAPCYKKYMVVTNVYLNDNLEISAQSKAKTADVNKCLEALKAANNQAYFNEVFDGDRSTVAFKLQAGYTYEIEYQAVDFAGWISGNKYYVTVK